MKFNNIERNILYLLGKEWLKSKSPGPFDTEGIFDLVITQLAIRAIGMHEILTISFKELTGYPSVFECSTREITNYRFFISMLHCQIMVRALP